MRRLAILLSLVAILSLNAILFLGTVVRDREAIGPVLNGLVIALDSSIVTSSGLLGLILFGRNRWLAVTFLLNLVIFSLALVLRLSGVVFSPAILFAADLYWLNLYVATLARYWEYLGGKP